MFTTCLFCHASLGTNEAIEHFPVGRRLAFDGDKGRLWVVCTKCGQWNLSPLEERWEAIEECERCFRETRLRVSTDNIGLARLPEGLTLVRIGRPQRPEFAAWRYGDQFGRRRRKHLLYTGGAVVAAGALIWGGAAAGIITGGMGWMFNLGFQSFSSYRLRGRTAVRLPVEGRAPLALTLEDVRDTRLVPDSSPFGWALDVAHQGPGRWNRGGRSWPGRRGDVPTTRFTGPDALRAARTILPALNPSGGDKPTVQEAVALIEHTRSPDAYFGEALKVHERRTRMRGDPNAIYNFTAPVRLALEMAAHEEIERRALEGELALLEQAWKEAEEVAAIADNMFLPTFVEDWMRKHRKG